MFKASWQFIILGLDLLKSVLRCSTTSHHVTKLFQWQLGITRMLSYVDSTCLCSSLRIKDVWWNGHIIHKEMFEVVTLILPLTWGVSSSCGKECLDGNRRNSPQCWLVYLQWTATWLLLWEWLQIDWIASAELNDGQLSKNHIHRSVPNFVQLDLHITTCYMCFNFTVIDTSGGDDLSSHACTQLNLPLTNKLPLLPLL